MKTERTLSGTKAVPRTVLIVDDHPLYRDALTQTVERVFSSCTCAAVGTMAEAYTLLDEGFLADVVILDLKLPDVAGISGLVQLRAKIPDRPIVVISALCNAELIQAAMDAGAAGFLAKDQSVEDLEHLLQEVWAGHRVVPRGRGATKSSGPRPESNVPEVQPPFDQLTDQQRRVLQLIYEGKPNKQIAYELDLAEPTVKAHITALLRRLGVRNRTQAAVLVETAQNERAGGDPDVRAFLAN